MPTDSSVALGDQIDKIDSLAECSSIETKLWANILSKGLLHADVRNLYLQACTLYENILLRDNEPEELQFQEYSLWKLHYKHIDEYRRRISQSSSNGENKSPVKAKSAANIQSIVDKHIEGFKLFLSDATKYYRNLIKKVKRYYGLFDDPLLRKDVVPSESAEQMQLHKCQFLCHRLSICLGDLARYLELYGKPEGQQRNWSTAAKYYLESAKSYPGGGNPHNQLAVLGMYVDDEFLALYHCIRSLAVKEPFPDALNNLILLFEKNRSTHINSVSDDFQFNFLKPSDRVIYFPSASNACSNSKTFKPSEQACSKDAEVWSLIIRMTSFFFLESSLEQFSCTLATTMREIESLLALDDDKLSIALESYQNLNLSKPGPYRALGIVSTLIFIIHNLTESAASKGLKHSNDMQQPMLVQLASTVAFICMGRLVERCLQGNLSDPLPLLPAILVFVEWLAGVLDEVDMQGVDDKYASAICYFLDSFVELLNKLQGSCSDVDAMECVALWEDYEMMGFAPVSHAHASLNFSTHQEYEYDFIARNKHRIHRLVHAAKKIANRPGDRTQKWIFFDQVMRNFCIKDAKEVPAVEKSEEMKSMSHVETTDPNPEKDYTAGEKKNESSVKAKSVAVEEEEDIVFKPLSRHNSAPLYRYLDNQRSREGTTSRTSYFDESLRRASSLLIAQNRALIDSLTSHSTISNNDSTKPNEQEEPHFKGSVSSTLSEAPISAGPPSLSAWVLNGESLAITRDNDTEGGKSVLQPIVEVASSTSSEISLNKRISSREVSATCSPSPPYCVPEPSAPLLPDDAVHFTNFSSGFPYSKASGIQDPSSFVAASSLGSYPSWSAAHALLNTPISTPSFIDHSSPSLEPTVLPPRPYSLKRNHTPGWSNSHDMQHDYYTTKDVHVQEHSRRDVLDGWVNPMASSSALCSGTPPFLPSPTLLQGVYNQRREMILHEYQRPNPYLCGTTTDMRAQHQPLLQYLKEKEWLLQQKSQFSASTYKRN